MVHVSRFESQKAFQYLKWAIRSTILEVNFWKTINTCIRKMSCTCQYIKGMGCEMGRNKYTQVHQFLNYLNKVQ